jgi:hypothetical protein
MLCDLMTAVSMCALSFQRSVLNNHVSSKIRLVTQVLALVDGAHKSNIECSATDY